MFIRRILSIVAMAMITALLSTLGLVGPPMAAAAVRTFRAFDLTADGKGYLMMSSRGEFYAYGSARPWPNPVGFSGSMVSVAVTADGQGALAMSSAGQFYAYGSARPWPNPVGFSGSMVSVAVTPDGQGALAMSSAGQFYAYGSARPWPNPVGFSGSMVSVAVTADGQGALAMSSAGQFYAYGSARPWPNPIGFSGSMVSVAVTADGQGALAVSSAGQLYAYGTARAQNNPVGFTRGISAVSLTSSGDGMAALSGAGEIYAYGSVQWLGNGDPGSSADGVTTGMLRQVFGVSSPSIDQGLDSLNAEMELGSITTAPRIAALLATLQAESGFRYNANEPCPSTVPYAPFCGRGFIQLTWESNYRAAGRFVGHDLIAHPGDASSLAYSAAIMRWYWTVSRSTLNASADRLDMAAVTRAVNGSGASRATLDARCASFKKVLTYYGYPWRPADVKCR